jgi:hypothetical protein
MTKNPLARAVDAVLGEQSIERDRDENYPWREAHGRLAEVLAGDLDARFAWPPRSDDDLRGFERSMAAGAPPIVEALRGLAPSVLAALAELGFVDVRVAPGPFDVIVATRG